jgi:hypothetical protein
MEGLTQRIRARRAARAPAPMRTAEATE